MIEQMLVKYFFFKFPKREGLGFFLLLLLLFTCSDFLKFNAVLSFDINADGIAFGGKKKAAAKIFVFPRSQQETEKLWLLLLYLILSCYFPLILLT